MGKNLSNYSEDKQGEGMSSRVRNNYIYDNLDKNPEAFIQSVLNKYGDIIKDCSGISNNDLIQEGWIGLMEAAERDFEVEFSTYAYFWVDKYIIEALTKEINTLEAERVNAETYKKDNSYQNGSKTIPNPNNEKRNSVSGLQGLKELDDKEKEILELYTRGYTQQEISEKPSIDYTQQNVSNIINQAIEKVGAFYET